MNRTIFWDIWNNCNEMWKCLTFLWVTVSVLRLPSYVGASICFFALGLCPFLPGSQSKTACAQSLSKALEKVDPSDFTVAFHILQGTLKRSSIPTLSEEQVTFQSSQQMSVHHLLPAPSQQNFKGHSSGFAFHLV